MYANFIDCNNSLEFFTNSAGDLLYFKTEEGKTTLNNFNDPDIDTLDILSKDLHKHPEAIKALEQMGIHKPIDQLRKYASCRYGSLDPTPDFVNGQATNSEYSECGNRNNCPHEFKLCAQPTTPNGCKLTKTEMLVATATAKDLSDNEIAYRLHKSPHTIKSHIKTIIQKLGCRSRNGIVAFIRKTHLL